MTLEGFIREVEVSSFADRIDIDSLRHSEKVRYQAGDDFRGSEIRLCSVDAESGTTVETKVSRACGSSLSTDVISPLDFRMDELLPNKNNMTYSDLVVLPDDNDMDVQADGGNEVTPPPIRYYFK